LIIRDEGWKIKMIPLFLKKHKISKFFSELFNTKRSKKVKKTLDRFIQQIYWGDDLTVEQSRKNLGKGLVEIVKYGQHSSNGILITGDGYFLTAEHCVTDGLVGAQIRLFNGNLYPVEKICGYVPKEDIALAKADIPYKCIPMEYRIYNTNKLGKMAVATMTRRYGKLIVKYGFVTREWNPTPTYKGGLEAVMYPNQFTMDIEAIPGDSGGIIVSEDGRLVGILSGGHEKILTGAGVKIISALELVDRYKRKLR